MQFYWKCTDCDEINNYSQTRVCETCGTDISMSEEHRIRKEIKLEEERKERERKERLRREELERKRKLEERLKKLEQERLQKLAEDRRKTTNTIKWCCKVPSIVLRSLISVAIVLAVVICVVNYSDLKPETIPLEVLNNINTEFDAHLDVIEVDKKIDDAEVVDKEGEDNDSKESEKNSELEEHIENQRIPHFANNIRKEFIYLSENTSPVENFKSFFKKIGKLLSGG